MRQRECYDEDCHRTIVEPEEKLTQMEQRQVLTHINIHYRSGFSSLSLLEENVKTTPAGLVFRLFSPLIELFNEKCHQLLAGGFIAHWNNHEFNPKGFKMKLDKIGPQVLTMEHVNVCFLSSLFVSISAEHNYIFL